MKRLEAIIAAAIITGVVALCMLLIGINALLNPNSVRASDAPTSAVLNASTGAADQTPISQLQNLITQYQNREKQYQDREQQYQTQLDQANAQIQQYQQVLAELQQSGVIRITNDGQILLRRGSGESGGTDGE